ncbi:uncharacterized protein V6R79_021683 [Siganus canaliculatus]
MTVTSACRKGQSDLRRLQVQLRHSLVGASGTLSFLRNESKGKFEAQVYLLETRTVVEGVTGGKLEAGKGEREGVGDAGIVSCHRRFVLQLLHVTCNQTHQGLFQRVNAAAQPDPYLPPTPLAHID